MTKFANLLATCALAAVVLAGCNDDRDSADPTPTAPTTSATPTPTQPAWMSKYNEKQLEAYEAALDRFSTYEQRAEPIWDAGKATPAAEALFKEFFAVGVWQTQLSRLKLYESVHVEVHGIPRVLRSQPTRVVLSKQGESVNIRQCVDYTSSVLMQNGEPAPGAAKKPAIRQVVLSRFVGAKKTPWQISTVRNTKRGCSG